MKHLLRLLSICLISITCAACQNTVKPQIVPAVEVKPVAQTNLNIIGEVEPIYFLPMKTPFAARVDTGAQNSSIDVHNLKTFERDGEKWVSFVLKNNETGESHRFEKEIHKQVSIKRQEAESEKRTMVMMDVKFGDEIINAQFSLANRDKFEYQTLIGRNILTGRAIVDTSLSNTLH